MLPEDVPFEEDLTTEPGRGHREPEPEAEQSGDAGKRSLRRALGRGLRGRFNRTDE